jgi:tetratricopeptide (TPR) repeat protein
MAQRQFRYQAGQKIGGKYEVYLSFMGGMGEVYLCLYDNRIPVALKTFQKTKPQFQALFEGEVKKWIDLGKHPNIVRCYWMESYDNTPFMALEWVPGDAQHGTDLRGWLRNGALDLKQSLKFAIDICRGLAYAGEKSKGIVHRDLKPDNVLVTVDGTAKITDFGLAIIQSDESENTGGGIGTLAYMPPEQWRSDVTIDARADMYAIGCILYEMLTGKYVYEAKTISQLRIQHFEAEIPQVPNVPAPVNAIITKCLAKKRDDRYQTIEALLDELTRFYESHIGEILPVVQVGVMTAGDYSNRGATYDTLELYELALVDLNEAIRLDPTYAQAYYNRGNSYYHLRQYEQAIANYGEAIRLNPTDTKSYTNRGASYAHLGQHAQAIADFDEAIRLNPTDAKPYTNRGASYQNLGQHEQAIADYDDVIHLNPTDANAYFYRGTSYQSLGQHTRAIADYDEAIRLNPTFAQAYNNRGGSYGDLGHLLRAIANFDEAIRLNPIYANAWFNKGALYGNLRRLPEALTCLEKAHELGHPQALSAIQQVKQAIGGATTTSPPQNDAQSAFDAFQDATSPEAMREAVGQYPMLIEPQFIQAIEQVIQTQVPPNLKPELEKRLAWLKQIAGGG